MQLAQEPQHLSEDAKYSLFIELSEVVIKNKKSTWWEERMKTANANESITPQKLPLHIYNEELLVQLDTPYCQRENEAVLLIMCEQADSDGGNAGSGQWY